MQKPSLFIVIEGLDGSGKTSAAKKLAELLEADAPSSTLFSFEPNQQFAAGQFIRDILEKRITEFHPRVLALAFATNRLDHCERLIGPFLAGKAGCTVICDRFYLSSLVYQSSSDFPFEAVFGLNEKARRPDLTFFLNVDAATCRLRMAKRNLPEELFEGILDESRRKYFEAIAFLRQKTGEQIVEIDGRGTVEETAEKMLFELKSRFFAQNPAKNSAIRNPQSAFEK